jgi:hypothetical protein
MNLMQVFFLEIRKLMFHVMIILIEKDCSIVRVINIILKGNIFVGGD